MKLISRLTLLLTAIIFFHCSPEKDRILQINGKVVNTDTKSIVLVKPNQDMRFDSLIEIPVQNGKFYYEHKLQNPEAVYLFLGEAKENGVGRSMPLFLENAKINLTLYQEEEFDNNIVEGGKLNAEYKGYKNELEENFNDQLQPLRDSIKSLFQKDQYNSDRMKEILSDLKEAKSQDEKIVLYKKMEILRDKGLDKTPIGKDLNDKTDTIYKKMKEYQQKYLEKNPTIVSYLFFLENLINDKETVDIKLAKSNYERLSQASLNHPYNDLALNLIKAIDNIKIGKKYVDFSAPDINGIPIKLSDEINGQIALLDLWATWCGPCIAKSRTMVSVYEDYKDRGFTIVGVAGEFKNTDRLETFLEKEKWPWLQLVDLDRQHKIWEQYGISNAGGGIFLIDGTGKIIAKDPTAEEVIKELDMRLN